MMKIIFLIILALPILAQALEVDEKLTVRVIKTSESKKTVMINRGTEDGLVEGDHARFIVTAGIVARAVCSKVSPTRSVWSVYRLVNADFMVNDSVMTIKITPPVKITKDESQALVKEDTPTKVASGDPAALGIPLAEGAQDMGSLETVEAADLKALEDDTPATLVDKNLEFIGMVNISALSASTKSDKTDSYGNSQSHYHIGLGAEYYPRREREWYSRLSLTGDLNLMRLNNQSYSGSGTTNEVTEFMVGVNWHPSKRPSATGEFIPYLHVGFGLSSLKSTYKPGPELASGSTTSATGNGNSFSIGLGYKFYTNRGFGARVLLDYYARNESYENDDKFEFEKSVRGPRLMIGLSYRF